MSHDELNEILAIASPRDRVLVLTGISFGTRISEALKLTFADVEVEVLHPPAKVIGISTQPLL